MNHDGAPLVDALLDQSYAWTPIRTGESGDLVYRRDDGHAYAKLAPAGRAADLAGERDRLLWVAARGVACPDVFDWRESDAGGCLVMSAVPGVPAVELSGHDLLTAWPSIARHLRALHQLPAEHCPFHRGLARMFDRATDVVARGAVNPAFLAEQDRGTPARELLARVASDLPLRLDQEAADTVVCHGDPCLPNFMVDPRTLECTGMIDLGRLGTADRYADLALTVANASESWTSPDQAERAFAMLFDTLGIVAPDPTRLAFYLRLDPLTWG